MQSLMEYMIKTGYLYNQHKICLYSFQLIQHWSTTGAPPLNVCEWNQLATKGTPQQ